MDPGRSGGPDELLAGSPEVERRRRTVLWVAGLVAAGVALAVVRPDVELLGDRPDPEASRGPSRAAAPPAPVSRDGIDWAPRGDLVDDDAFVSMALGRVRESRTEATRLFFAGSLPDGSRLVIAGTDVNRGIVATSVHALRVPRGVPVGRAEVTEGVALTDPQAVLAWAAHAEDGTVYAVAMARPGPARFGVSPRVEFTSDGSPRRAWSLHYAEDGVVVADLGRDADPMVAVRAQGPGVFSVPLLVRVVTGTRGSQVLTVRGTDAATYRGPDPAQLSRALRAGLGSVVHLEAVPRTVIWSGVPWKERRLALVLVTRPDGRRFQALVGQQGSQAFTAGVRALPTGAEPTVPWLLEPFSTQDPTLLLCPTGPGSLLYERDGQADLRIPVKDDGVAALVAPGPTAPSAGGARVTLRDPSGRLLLSTVLPEPGFDDPLALD